MYILIRWLTTPLLLMTITDLVIGVCEISAIYCTIQAIKIRKEMKRHANRRENRRNSRRIF